MKQGLRYCIPSNSPELSVKRRHFTFRHLKDIIGDVSVAYIVIVQQIVSVIVGAHQGVIAYHVKADRYGIFSVCIHPHCVGVLLRAYCLHHLPLVQGYVADLLRASIL